MVWVFSFRIYGEGFRIDQMPYIGSWIKPIQERKGLYGLFPFPEKPIRARCMGFYPQPIQGRWSIRGLGLKVKGSGLKILVSPTNILECTTPVPRSFVVLLIQAFGSRVKDLGLRV